MEEETFFYHLEKPFPVGGQGKYFFQFNSGSESSGDSFRYGSERFQKEVSLVQE